MIIFSHKKSINSRRVTGNAGKIESIIGLLYTIYNNLVIWFDLFLFNGHKQMPILLINRRLYYGL